MLNTVRRGWGDWRPTDSRLPQTSSKSAHLQEKLQPTPIRLRHGTGATTWIPRTVWCARGPTPDGPMAEPSVRGSEAGCTSRSREAAVSKPSPQEGPTPHKGECEVI